MAISEDITGKTYGYLQVVAPAPDKITPSGQKRKMCSCRCLLCGTEKVVGSNELKSGKILSCGCLRAIKGKQQRNIKICVECGRQFECPPSDKTVTCSPECRRIHARKRQTGKAHGKETRSRISKSAQSRDMSDIQRVGTEAAKASPKSGRFETNVNAKDWHLVSPEGKHYYFHSLSHWLRENGKELFGCDPDGREFNNVRSGLSNAKRAMHGIGNYGCCTYKGWRVITNDD